MSDIYRYISTNYHTFFMESRGMYSVDYETLIQDLYNIISDLFRTGKFVVNNIPKLIFINTAERKSKYIVTNDEHYILLDLRQILECAWGSRVAIGIDGDIFSVVSAGSRRDEDNYDVDMSLYLYSSDQNILKARVCNCYNLADLCFSKGYVDAAIKNLCSIMAMREDIHSNNLADLMFSAQFLYETKIIGEFIYIHELTHFFFGTEQKKHKWYRGV